MSSWLVTDSCAHHLLQWPVPWSYCQHQGAEVAVLAWVSPGLSDFAQSSDCFAPSLANLSASSLPTNPE
jgi:hypothetical protein